MRANFQCWGERRKDDINGDNSIADKTEELRKVDERVEKFKAKFSFLGDYRPPPAPQALGTPRAQPQAGERKRRVSLSASMIRSSPDS
jgi:hypothetical protein